MSAASAVAEVTVPFFAAVLCITPAVTRPTVPFGVRVPGERAGARVIRQERRAYFWRTAAIGIGCTVVALLVQGHGSWWLTRLIVLAEVAADLGCFLIARKKITAVKSAEHWFAGHRQTIATDTSWRTDPPRFPVRWLIPAVAVIAATVVIGVVRYPDLPARLAVGFGGPGHHVPKSVLSTFAVVVSQLYVTALWTGLMLIVYRSRPDIEAADAVASTRRYRRFLAAMTRAVLTLLALVDLSLLLVALQNWQVYRPSGPGSALPVLPFAVGLLVLMAVGLRAGQGGYRLSGGDRAYRLAVGTDRDDDRFWKAGLIYVNRDDPAIMVGARFGFGWTFNMGNPMAWLIIAGIVAAPAGLAAIGAAAGLLAPGQCLVSRTGSAGTGAGRQGWGCGRRNQLA
jgi:uncharacterized membrane protein